MPRSAFRGVRTNAQSHGPVLEEVARADGTGLTLLRDAADAMRLSARGYHRVLRVARTLADLDGATQVAPRASGRGAVLPRARRRSAAGGVSGRRLPAGRIMMRKVNRNYTAAARH